MKSLVVALIFGVSVFAGFSAHGTETYDQFEQSRKHWISICTKKFGYKNASFCRRAGSCIWNRVMGRFPTKQSIRRVGRSGFHRVTQRYTRQCIRKYMHLAKR